jgi:hypothetical protein
LVFGRQIPVVPLALFLYRDFAFDFPEVQLTLLVAAFREEFGYSGRETDGEFTHLYVDDGATRAPTEYFQPA